LNSWDGLSAFITMSLGAIIVLVPVSFIGTQIFQEAKGVYVSFDENLLGLVSAIHATQSNISEWFPALENISIDIEQYLKDGLLYLTSNLASLFSSFAKLAMSFFVFLISLYYALRDGNKLKSTIIKISPLEDSDDLIIFGKLEKTIHSVLLGSLMIAIIQGTLVSIGFTIFGIPNATLWGSLAVISALIPGVGTALIVIPAVIFLFLSGALPQALGLLMWGVVIVGLVDNLLGPRLLGRGTEIHPILILLAVLGGIGLFGPIGFLLGPLIVSLLLSLIEIYLYIVKKYSN
jgi:predicted PurR-regulated permease PerM